MARLLPLKFSRVGVLLLGLALLAGCSEPGTSATPAPQVREVRVSTVEITPSTIQDALVLPGQTEAEQDVLLSAEQSGRVEWVGPREGSRISRGEGLARIDVAALQAALDRAEASARLATAQAERRSRLHDKELLAGEELELALTEETLALAALRDARVALAKGVVRAPFTGTVNHLHVDPGEFVNVGDPVAELVDTQTLRILVSVPELDVRHLRQGQPARVTVDAWPGQEWEGQVDFLAVKADPATKTFTARVVVDNSDGRIRPGMLARVTLLKQVVDDALVVPLFAVVDKGGEYLVFVVEDGVARARTVTFGVVAQDRVQIVSGLEPGDRVVVSGQTEIEDGTRVALQ